MRRNRIIWFGLWILSIIGISNYGGPITYGLFAALTLVPVFSLIYLIFVYAFFHIYQKIEKRYVVVNEKVIFHFNLVNEYFLLFSGIKVIYFSSFSTISGLDGNTEYELLPGTGVEKTTSLLCHYRGEYNVGIKRIEVQDFFRLFKISYKNRECVSAVVKPQLVKLESLGKIELLDSFKDSRVFPSELDVLSRDYLPGDDVRLIQWSQYSRTGELRTRERIGQEFQRISIITDTFRKSNKDLEYIPLENKVLETTLALSFYLSRNYIDATEYHLASSLISLPVGNANKFDEYYEAISAISFDDRYTQALLFEEVIRKQDIFNSSMIFMVIQSIDEVTVKFLEILEKNGLRTVIYYITENASGDIDLSKLRFLELIRISPFEELREVMK